MASDETEGRAQIEPARTLSGRWIGIDRVRSMLAAKDEDEPGEAMEPLIALVGTTWLQGPVPPRLSATLIAYLSRFCVGCVDAARSAASISEHGAAGLRLTAPLLDARRVAELLSEPLPTDGELRALARALAQTPEPLCEWPEADSAEGRAVRIVCGQMLLAPHRGAAWRIGLRRLLGAQRCAQLMTFMAVVRAVHLWLQVHRGGELESETDEPPPEPHGAESSLLGAHEADVEAALGAPAVSELRALRDRAAAAAAESLRDSERRFRAMADQAPVMIWLSDASRGCTWFNRPWLEFVGRSLEQEVGSGWNDNVHPEDLPRCLASYGAAFDARQPFTVDCRIRRHDGAYRWVVNHGVPLHEPDEGFSGYVGSCIDITDRKEAELSLLESDRRKDAFLATLAHELRNPLAPIRNAVALLGHAEPATRAWARDVIDRQSQQMQRLIDDLLDVSRISTGRLELRTERVDLGSVVQLALETCLPMIQAHAQVLTTRLPPERVFLRADRTRLAQAVANLLSNAVRYSGPSGRIALSAERRDREVSLTVEDRGMGISPELLPRIFEPFVQGDRAPEHAQAGLGVGLTLAKELVELHGGRIEARSAGRGAGASFTIVLPLSQAVATPRARASAHRTRGSRDSHASSDAGARRRSRALRILVADDNTDAAESLATLLRVWSHEVDVVHDGLAALERFRERHYEVALLDIGMPRLDGHQTARRIRELPGGSAVLIAALTGWGQAEDRQRSTAAGFDHHLVKPIDPAALEALLAERSDRGQEAP